MFEKEAEEMADKKHPIPKVYNGTDIARNSAYRTGFKDGAEFGYNKANEWHYVKNGDLPKDEKLCLIWCGEKDFCTAEYVRGRFWDLCGGWLEVDEVIAWKEIVMPKESE